MALEITHQDDSPLSGLSLTVERGVPSALIDLKIKNTGDLDVSGAFVTLYAETAPGSGVYVSQGQPAVDELMGRFQITGQDATATPGQEIVLGVVQPLGHLAVGLLPTIGPGNWLLADLWLDQGGASAGGGSINLKVEAARDTAAYPIPFGVSQVGTGIDSGRKQPRSFIINGRAGTATGTPDDEVHFAAGDWLFQGEEYADATIQDVAFDQNDFDVAALASGEVYVAVVTQGTADAPTVTKGVKATSGSEVKPTPPVGELILAFVTVLYSAGATVVSDSDIEDERKFGRYKIAAPPTGLTVTVFPGEAVIGNFRQVKSVAEVVALTASVVNRVWLEWNGAIVVTLSDIPPSAGAVKLADVTTDGSNVTVLSDTRTYIRPLDPGSLQVKETDGAPDVLGVEAIRFPPDSVTNDGGGQVTIAFPGISLGDYVVRETPAGAVNGTNPTFTLAFTPAGSGQETVYLNGLIQDGGAGNDYTIAAAVITFAVAPTTGDKIRCTYFKV